MWFTWSEFTIFSNFFWFFYLFLLKKCDIFYWTFRVNRQINKVHSTEQTHIVKSVSRFYMCFEKKSDQKEISISLCLFMAVFKVTTRFWQIYWVWPDWLAAICQLSICRPVSSLPLVLPKTLLCEVTSDDLLVFAQLCQGCLGKEAYKLSVPSILNVCVLSEWATGDKHFMT